MKRPCLGHAGYRCPRLVDYPRSRCADCSGAIERGRNARRQPELTFYSSGAWQRLRRQVMQDATACAWCGATGVRLTADHVRTVRDYPSLALEPSNVVPSCRSCQVRRQYGPGGGRSTG